MDATAWDERYQGTELVWGSEPNRFVREMCEHLSLGRAVDLACGEGRNAIWLARLGWNVVGVDFSTTAIERAVELTSRLPEQARLRLSWRVEDVTTSPPRPVSADLVLISYLHLLPHQTEPLVAAAARAVRPGGHLVVVGHDRRNLAEGVGGPQDPRLLYDPSEVAMTVVDEGLQVQLAETVQRHTDNGTALDTVVRARRPRD